MTSEAGALLPALLLAAVALAALAAAEAPPAGEAPETITWPTSVGEVVFDHRMHSEDFAADCVTCHHETHAARLEMPHPEYFEDFWIDCASCHGETAPSGEPRACSDCHHASPATIADETLSSKVVLHESCWQCHEVGRGQEASRGCAVCHRQQAPAAGGEVEP